LRFLRDGVRSWAPFVFIEYWRKANFAPEVFFHPRVVARMRACRQYDSIAHESYHKHSTVSICSPCAHATEHGETGSIAALLAPHVVGPAYSAGTVKISMTDNKQ
jgi:hypothetical protein